MIPSSPLPSPELTAHVRAAALSLGFARVGFARVERFDAAADRLRAWLDAGHGGDLAYLDGPGDRADARALLPEARSIVSVALPHAPPVKLRRSRTEGPALTGEVAAYALGTDYHIVLKDKLKALAERCVELGASAFRACVDTAPLLEREAAERAGIGFTGKSTLIIAPGVGTRFLLGELLVDLDLEPSEPVAPGCGRCTACMDRCPTGAFVGPYVLDARRCLSYLTIEAVGPIPRELRSLVGLRVFGCDECQDACPFNASGAERPPAPELAPRPHLEAPDLVHLLEIGAASYRKLVKRSALRRIGKVQLKRNAAVALGNTGDARAVPPLVRALARDKSALVRVHVAWALGRLGGAEARAALEHAAADDPDADVRTEAELALDAKTAVRVRDR